MERENERARNAVHSVLFLFLSFALINFLGDPRPGSKSYWASLGARGRGFVRFSMGALLGILASFVFSFEFAQKIMAMRQPDAMDLPSVILFALVVYPCVWTSWGLHGIVTGTDWNESRTVIRVVYISLGCLLGMFAVLFSRVGLERLAASYYRDNPRFSILQDHTIELKRICSESFDISEERKCLSTSRPRVENMRADVERLLRTYPSLKSHEVLYTDPNDATGKTSEVFSYENFMEIYKRKVSSP